MFNNKSNSLSSNNYHQVSFHNSKNKFKISSKKNKEVEDKLKIIKNKLKI